jgi:hypothetical protein
MATSEASVGAGTRPIMERGPGGPAGVVAGDHAPVRQDLCESDCLSREDLPAPVADLLAAKVSLTARVAERNERIASHDKRIAGLERAPSGNGGNSHAPLNGTHQRRSEPRSKLGAQCQGVLVWVRLVGCS